jgi:hypothetical protein
LIHEPNNGGDTALRKITDKKGVHGISRAIEVDSLGVEVSSLYTSIFDDTAYRAVPFKSLLGEAKQL